MFLAGCAGSNFDPSCCPGAEGLLIRSEWGVVKCGRDCRRGGGGRGKENPGRLVTQGDGIPARTVGSSACLGKIGRWKDAPGALSQLQQHPAIPSWQQDKA